MSTAMSPTVTATIGGAASAQTSAIAPARLAQIKKTAQQFEAIFVRQMLSAAHKSSFGETITNSSGNSGSGSQGVDTFTEMQDSRFADIAAQKGAFGLAHMIEKQLIHREALNAGHAPMPAATTAAAPAHAAPSVTMPGTGG